MLRAVKLVVGCGLLIAITDGAVMASPAPVMIPSIRTSSNGMKLRGGGEEVKKTMKRVMSHEDINTETHGEADTLETRFFAKDGVEGEHRSLWHICRFSRATSTPASLQAR